MTDTSAAELTLTEATPTPELSSAPAPALELVPTHARPAVRRCCAAYRRAFNAYMEASDGDSYDKMKAAGEGGLAYRNAMPLLSDYEGIRDFIACTAHGILIGAIPPERSGHLLYAAQVALSTLHREPKPRKSA
ncbi:MAG: hypothetical protein WCA89_10535 [Terracidiphilus sp.]